MDEAERCHRLAILDRGVKVADGAPSELQDRTAMSVVEVLADDPGAAQAALHDSPDVRSVTQLGMRLRVLIPLAVEDPLELIRSTLTRSGITAETRTVRPSLEDVFVAVTQADGGAEPAQ
jgi:ABC-2 type transport system ATP-binding protein